MRVTGYIRLIGLRLVPLALAGALSAFAQPQPPWAKSPFVLTVETAEVKPSHVDVRVALAFPPKHIVYAESFRVLADTAEPLEKVSVPAPDEKPDLLDPAKTVQAYAHAFETVWRLTPRRNGVRVTVAFQGCDDSVCFMPEEHVFRFEAASDRFIEETVGDAAAQEVKDDWRGGLRTFTGGGYMSADEFLAFLDQAEGQPAAAGRSGLSGFLRDPVVFFHAHGMVLTLLLVLVGGVLLNLTPCVLPMIPINLAIIGAGAGTRGRGFLLGTAYGAGMVLVYGGMGWAILRSGLFFGALQSSPWFSLSVALVFIALALALFDVFVIDFTRFSATGSGRRQGLQAALFAGGLSALLAGACVAPVVLAVLLLAGSLYAGGATGAQFLPFVLGLGMALPWPFAGAGLSVLPHPGRWMVRVKQAFGIFLVILSVYYFYLAAVGFQPASRVSREGSILAGDAAAWREKVEQAKRAGKPVFADFWATWCKNCSAMEKTTFADERVRARLANYVVVKVQAEKPDKSPAKEMLKAFEVRGLPGFVVLK
jgi:thiol:disulfide interchange protein